MKILVIAPHGMYYDYTLSFVHHQAKTFVQMGHQVRVVVPLAFAKRSNEGHRFGPFVEIFERDGVEVCYLRHLSLSNYGSKHFNTPSALLALRMNCAAVLRDFVPDVIHAHTIGLCTKLGVWLKRKYHCPLVITTHGGDTDVSIQPENRAKAKALCDQADALIAVSRTYMEKAKQMGTTTRLLHILNGFAFENLTSAEREPLHVVQVGSLCVRKHAELTIQAVAALREKYPGISLTIVGDGPEYCRFEALCKQLEIEDAVTFLGNVTNPEALKEMARAQIFCMPSVLEGFGIVYLEAMASGCVTIGTEGEGIDGVIISGENGYLIPPLDVEGLTEVIDRCFQDESLTHRIADAGRATAMSMTWENNAKQYIDLFCELRREQQGTCGV